MSKKISALDAKTTPLVDADILPIIDSEALTDATKNKKITWATLKTAIGGVFQLLNSKDATGGYVGLTLFKINFKNTANTITNFFTNATTAVRTWTFPDKDGTVAMTDEIVVKSIFDAEGDIIVGTGADTYGKLAKGTSGKFLKAGASTISYETIAITDLGSFTKTQLNTALSDADIAELGANTFTGIQTISNSTESTSIDSGCQVLSGGLGVAKKSFFGDDINLASGKVLKYNGTDIAGVFQLLSGKDATGGYVGLTSFKINFKNAANTITNFFTNATTAIRTWTFPDRDGTVAMTSDIDDLLRKTANVTSAELLTGVSDDIIYVKSKEAIYKYCSSCTIARDGDLILNTGTGGNTRWQLIQKVSRTQGDTGWINTDSVVLTKVTATKARMTLSGVGVISINSIRYEVPIGNYDITITGTAGIKYIYIDSSLTLQLKTTLWDFSSEVPVMLVYWSGTAIVAGLQTEFHGIRDTVWHLWAHRYLGTQYKDGLTFTGSVQPDTTADPGVETVQYLWSTDGTCQDEDAVFTPGTGNWSQDLGSGLTNLTAGIFNFFYYNGSFITTQDEMADRTPFIYSGANGTPRWENAGVLTDSVTGEYIVYHYFASPMCGGWSVFGRPHNAKYTTLASAQIASPTDLTWSDYAELKHIYTAIFRVRTGWDITHRAKLVSLKDYRKTSTSPSNAVPATNHNSLSNRSDINSHPILASHGTENGAIPFHDTTSLGLIEDSALNWNNSTKTLSITNLLCTIIGLTASRITKGWFTDIESTNYPSVNGTPINAKANSWSAIQTISNSTESTNINSGCQILTGGLGVAKDIFAGQKINIIGTEITVANKNKHKVHITDGTEPLFRRQTYSYNGSSYVVDFSHGFGIDAIANNSGAYCSGIGYEVLKNNTGNYSNGFGFDCLKNNTGNYSNGFGCNALDFNTGDYSNGVGHFALYQNSGVSSNGIGYVSLRANAGIYCSGVGYASLSFNTGNYSNGFGSSSLSLNNWNNSIEIGHHTTSSFVENASSVKSFTDDNITTNTITITTHGFGTTGRKINLKFKTTAGTPPTGLVHNAIYQFTITDANTLTLSGITAGAMTADFAGTLTNSVDTTNSIAIGNDVTATKANQVIIGDSSVTETVLNGNVNIPTGKVYQINSVQIKSTDLSDVTSGVYTPAITGVSNIDAITAKQCQYMRVGSVVTVSGAITVDPTTAGVTTDFTMALPIASLIGAVEDCSGTGRSFAYVGGWTIQGEPASDRAYFKCIDIAGTTSTDVTFTFTYRII